MATAANTLSITNAAAVPRGSTAAVNVGGAGRSESSSKCGWSTTTANRSSADADNECGKCGVDAPTNDDPISTATVSNPTIAATAASERHERVLGASLIHTVTRL